jgi:hypothetical protein
MTFSTERLTQLKDRVAELTLRVGTDTPEAIARSCNNPVNDEDASWLRTEYDMRMGYFEELIEAKARLEEYLGQYD